MTGKSLTIIQLGAELLRLEITIRKISMLGYCFIYPTDETTIAVAFIAYKAAIKEAIIKIQLTTQRMSNKTAIGSISIDRTFEGYRRLAVVELNHTILIHLAYYTATEFGT